MSNYVELLRRHLQAYKTASNGFHTADAGRKISDAIAGFALHFDELSEIIRRQRASRHAGSDFAIASREVLRLLDAQLNVLETAVRSAERSDKIKVLQIVVDRHVAKRKAEAQQAADAELVRQIKALISQAHNDVREAGKMRLDDGGASGDDLGPIDLKGLERSIEERRAPKEDAILAEQLALIGGQASSDVEDAGGRVPGGGGFRGGNLGPIDIEELKKSIEERAAPKEDLILAEQLALIGGQASEGPDDGDDLGPIDLKELKRSIKERAAPKEDAILAGQLAIVGGQASPPEDFIAPARGDARAGGQVANVGGLGGGDLGPIDVDELRRSIKERAAPKEDTILAEQLAIVGGQASPA